MLDWAILISTRAIPSTPLGVSDRRHSFVIMCARRRHAFAGRSGAHFHSIARLATFLTIGRGIADNNQHGGIPSGFSGGPALAGVLPPMSPKRTALRARSDLG